MEVKTETNCLIVAIAKLTNDPDCKAYRKGRKIYPKADRLLATRVSAFVMVAESTKSNVFRTIFGNIRSLCIQG